MTKRTVFHVVYDSERKLWVAKVSGMIVSIQRTKRHIIWIIKYQCRHFWRTHRIPCQMVIHNKNGIAREHTYGRDPKRSRG